MLCVYITTYLANSSLATNNYKLIIIQYHFVPAYTHYMQYSQYKSYKAKYSKDL